MHQKILIRYRPTEREPVSGHLTIRSNDSTHPLVRIPIASTVPAPELSVSPGDLEFEPLDPEGGGGCDFDRINRQTFQVRNSGSDDLFVTGWELDPPEAEEAFEVCATGKWGLDLAYAPSQERAWRVVFWPPYPGTYQAAVHLESTGGVARVQLSATDAREPHLAVSPALLAWPLLAPGESEGQTLVLSNDGSFPTTVRSFAIEPAEAADAYAIVSDALAPEGTGLAEPIPIGGRVEVEVVHTAAAEPVEATLRIEHDAVDQESPVAVLLRGTSPIPMVEAEPPALTFAAPPPGEPVTKHLRVVNPGGEPVQVWSVSVGAAPGAPEEPLPAFTIDPPDLEGTLEPGTGRLFAVTYTRPAQDAQDETACLVVTGDDPRRNEPLCALLSALQSPEGTPPTAAIEVIPDVTVPLGTELTFDATTSSDPDAGDGITAWRWLLLARPPGGAVGLVGEGPTVTLTPDTLGAWTVALEVTDGTGLPSDETLLAVDVVEPL